MTKNPTDTNQASEDELDEILKQSYKHIAYSFIATLPPELKYYYSKTAQTLDYEKEFNYTKAAIQSIIRTEKLKLLAELDKSMPTAEQLTTKYGYHMPDKQYGYKLALHDIREVLTKLEAEL